MAEVVKLKLADKPEIPSAKEQMLKTFDEKAKALRDWLEHTEDAGYALVGYDKRNEDGRPTVHSWANYFCSGPGDAFWLPDMVKARIYQRVHEE